MAKRFVQLKEPDVSFLTPGDEWFAPRGVPFFHKVWTGETMGWSTGALSEYPEDLPESEQTADGTAGEPVEEPPSDGEVGELESDEASEEEEGQEYEDEESTDGNGDSTEVSDSDGGVEESGGESGTQPAKRRQRRKIRKGGKSK
jgi:hypothetical protein